MKELIEASEKYVAIVLAGDRTDADPVAAHSGVACKAIAEIDGRPMIMRVLDALQESGAVKSIILCGPPEAGLQQCPELAARIERDDIQWLKNLDSPSLSVLSALEAVEQNEKVLLTTADHALLNAEIIRHFSARASANAVDLSVGLVEYSTVNEAYPEVKRTVLKFREIDACGCNLFALTTVKGRKLVSFWHQVEQSRKKPTKMLAGVLGAGSVLLYLLRLLSLERALTRVSKRLGVSIKPVVLPFARAGIDVDTVKDKQLVERILAEDRADS